MCHLPFNLLTNFANGLVQCKYHRHSILVSLTAQGPLFIISTREADMRWKQIYSLWFQWLEILSSIYILSTLCANKVRNAVLINQRVHWNKHAARMGGSSILQRGAASEAKNWQCSEVELHEQNKLLWRGSRAHLRTLAAFGVSMLKYTFSHILEPPFLTKSWWK